MSPQPAHSTGGATAPLRRKSRRLLWIALAAAIAIAGGVFAWVSRTLPIDTVVVRPLASGGGPDWLAGAITEEIVDTLRPVTRPTTDPMFTAVLEGSIVRSGDRVRLTASLTRGDGHHYWTRTIERPLAEIAREVAGAIVPAARKRAPRHKPAATAYEHYLQARQLFQHQEFTKAIEGFDAAAQVDPEFALAYAWAAIAREQVADLGAARPNDILPAARDDAERAVILAPDSGDTHLALGIVKLQYDWDWDAARRELERALELSPGNPLAVHWRERWLEAMNRAPSPALDLANVPREPEAARLLLAQADDLRAQSYVTPIGFALAANLLHDVDSVFYWLDVAYDERCAQLPYLLRNPALPQADPRLRELIRRLKLPTDQ
jgi:hypothetical protein